MVRSSLFTTCTNACAMSSLVQMHAPSPIESVYAHRLRRDAKGAGRIGVAGDVRDDVIGCGDHASGDMGLGIDNRTANEVVLEGVALLIGGCERLEEVDEEEGPVCAADGDLADVLDAPVADLAVVSKTDTAVTEVSRQCCKGPLVQGQIR